MPALATPHPRAHRRRHRAGPPHRPRGRTAPSDELRGLKDGFDHGLRTLLRLRSLGVKDIGFGITLSPEFRS